jgi:hypothetical protein
MRTRENKTEYATARAEAIPLLEDTTTETVRRIGAMNFSGNVIPHAWLQHPLLRFKESGLLNTNAVLLLADLIYWYRPVEIRDEATGQVVERRRRFRRDLLQKSYEAWGKGLGLTKRQAQEAAYFLRDASLITIETRTLEMEMSTLGNVTFFEPIPDAIAEITFGRRDTSHAGTGEGLHSSVRGTPVKRERYPRETGDITEITTENTTETTIPDLSPGPTSLVDGEGSFFIPGGSDEDHANAKRLLAKADTETATAPSVQSGAGAEAPRTESLDAPGSSVEDFGPAAERDPLRAFLDTFRAVHGTAATLPNTAAAGKQAKALVAKMVKERENEPQLDSIRGYIPPAGERYLRALAAYFADAWWAERAHPWKGFVDNFDRWDRAGRTAPAAQAGRAPGRARGAAALPPDFFADAVE